MTARFIGLSLDYAFPCGHLRTPANHKRHHTVKNGKRYETTVCRECAIAMDARYRRKGKDLIPDYLLIPGRVME